MCSRPSDSTSLRSRSVSPSAPNAPSTTPAVPELSAAATTVARRPAGDSGSSRAEKARSRPFAVGIRSASASVPASWPGVSKWGNSTSASGFPRAASRIDFSTSGAMRPSFAASTRVESSRSSGPTGTSWRPGMFGAPGRCAATKTARTPARRREANESASRDAESTHCRSSTTISVGPSSAAAARSPSVATPTAKRSKAPGGPSASAADKAAAWASGSASRRCSTGVSTSMSAA